MRNLAPNRFGVPHLRRGSKLLRVVKEERGSASAGLPVSRAVARTRPFTGLLMKRLLKLRDPPGQTGWGTDVAV